MTFGASPVRNAGAQLFGFLGMYPHASWGCLGRMLLRRISQSKHELFLAWFLGFAGTLTGYCACSICYLLSMLSFFVSVLDWFGANPFHVHLTWLKWFFFLSAFLSWWITFLKLLGMNCSPFLGLHYQMLRRDQRPGRPWPSAKIYMHSGRMPRHMVCLN